ncbi:alpha-amylase family protein [Nesterenkonia sp. YGD6]|uniref:alpha-amylase family protein n=1 Tax=Nesterenkonia sp. YGD6 TaxID=2901231 RepID=UPI001F4C7F79|nr:alpha-amylase family protein [Nesterenkonia sp. YGD6]MCH8563728.1 alpha-amylase family protein [Nesterenkonia sp. YGD6]
MRITDTADLWYKNAVIYCVDLETYLDSDGDGIGDLPGLTRRIDYLADIGVSCLWLMPFYPSPRRDNGYDISDMFGVDRRYGDHGDFVELVRVAHDRGIRVIVDLVINHTSDQHPWFRSSRASKDSPYRDFYVWRSDTPPDTSEEAMFPGQEGGIWTHDEKTEEWYLHHFLHTQPDLNTSNPQVRDAITKTMGFWLQLGVDGFRVDAVPFAINQTTLTGADQHDFVEPHDYLRTLRAFLQRRSTGTSSAMILGEVNLPHQEQLAFFGGEDGDQLTMQFDFTVNQKAFLSFAREDARPLAEALAQRPQNLPTETQYANFLRNHDELTLDLLSAAERDEVLDTFAPEENMRFAGRGLRRRLPAMFDGDPRRIKMAYSLLFSLPGTPVLFYGEEIGMGENLEVPGREAVRTPMQWSQDKNGGFSSARPSKLARKVVEGPFGPEHVNAAQARRDEDSLLHHVSRLARRYRDCPELGWGELSILQQPHHEVLAHRMTSGDQSMVLIHNLSPKSLVVPLMLEDEEKDTELIDLLQDGACAIDAEHRTEVTLDGYGCRWLRVKRPGDPRLL